MEYTTLGSTGTKVSRLCLGTWRFGRDNGDVIETTREEAHDLLEVAYERGINFIDTANRYGDPPGTSEQYIGEWLTERDREEFVIASKVGLRAGDGVNDSGLSRKHIRQQITATLERLGTDYLDVYYIHRLDEATPIEETLATLSEFVESGTVHYLGASTMAAWQLTKLLWKCDTNGWERIEVAQPPVDATLQNPKRYTQFDIHRYLEVCADQDIGVCPYSPLAGGFLTGKYEHEADAPKGARAALVPDDFERKYISEQSWNVLEAVNAVAEELDTMPAQVALRWVMQQERFSGSMIPIVGARSPEQLVENVGAVDIRLSVDQLARIDEARDEPLLS